MIRTPSSERWRRSRSATSRDVADAEPVDERDARLDPVDDARRGSRAKLDHGAVLGDHDAVGRHARVPGELAVRREHPVLAVRRHDAAGSHEGEHRAQLLGAGVPGDVHVRDLLVQHLGAHLGEPVDRVVHAQLVPRHGLRREDDGVAAVDRDRRMVVVGDPRERRHRLALAAGAEDHHLARRQVHRLLRLDDHALVDRQVAQGLRDVEVLLHRPADDRHLAADLGGDVDRLLHPVHVRREGDDEDPPAPQRDQRAEGLADEALRAGHPGPLGVRRVAEEQIDALVAELGESADVGLQAVDGRVIQLPVAGVEDATRRGVEDDRHRVGDRVRHAHEVEPEGADLDRLAHLGLA